MAAVSLRRELNIEIITCGECGVEFGLTDFFVAARKQSHANFYCPNGHARHWPAKNEAEVLKEKLAAVEKERDAAVKRKEWAEQAEGIASKERDAAKAEAARLRKRAQNGACPCCKRTFSNLARHMAIKHPESPEAGQAAKDAEREERETASPRSKP